MQQQFEEIKCNKSSEFYYIVSYFQAQRMCSEVMASPVLWYSWLTSASTTSTSANSRTPRRRSTTPSSSLRRAHTLRPAGCPWAWTGTSPAVSWRNFPNKVSYWCALYNALFNVMCVCRVGINGNLYSKLEEMSKQSEFLVCFVHCTMYLSMCKHSKASCSVTSCPVSVQKHLVQWHHG